MGKGRGEEMDGGLLHPLGRQCLGTRQRLPRGCSALSCASCALALLVSSSQVPLRYLLGGRLLSSLSLFLPHAPSLCF